MADPLDTGSSRPDRSADNRCSSASLPARDGNASHTLVEGQLVEMTAFLFDHPPGCMSTALSLLKENFPETTVELRNQACAIFLERL